jgi:hypothetical protein
VAIDTHMRYTAGADAPATALCNASITSGLTGDVAAVTCISCREQTWRIIAEQEEMRRGDLDD